MGEKTSRRLKFIIDILFYAVIAALVYLSIRYVVPWTLPFIIAFLLVSIVHPVIRWIKRKLRIERNIVSLIIILLVYLLFSSLLVFLVTQLIFLFRDLFSGLPAYYDQTLKPAVLSLSEGLSHFMQNLPEEWQEQTTILQEGILSALQTALMDISQWGISAISRFTTRIPSFFIAMFFTVMLSFFMSMQYEQVTAFLRSLLPDKIDRKLSDFNLTMKETVVRYLHATLTLMIITFAELSVGLLFLGKPKAVLAALGIAIFDALPIFGTGAIMIPWAVIDLVQGDFSSAFGIAILYGLVTLVRNVIEPKIVSDRLGLNPIASLTAIYLGYRTMGVTGMIIMPIITQISVALHRKGWFSKQPHTEDPGDGGEGDEDEGQAAGE